MIVRIALADELVGLPEAIATVAPATQVFCGIGHLVRKSFGWTNWTKRESVASECCTMCRVTRQAAAMEILCTPADERCGTRYLAVVAPLRRHFPNPTPVDALRSKNLWMLYTIDAIESLHMLLRKLEKTHGHLPHHNAATDLQCIAPWNNAASRLHGERYLKPSLPALVLLVRPRFPNRAKDPSPLTSG